mmetsp:Transcript_3009/g.5981  ORF Transcript_3009/g.5981 Transcript_3009/m.5981 type:complete len:420 (-) Transcript_3009:509-1768(-)
MRFSCCFDAFRARSACASMSAALSAAVSTSQLPLVTDMKFRSRVRHVERRAVLIPVTAALDSDPSASPDFPPGGSIVLLARLYAESLKKTGRFVASIWTALIDSEYDFCERQKSSWMLFRSSTKAFLSSESAPAFSAADSIARYASAAGLIMPRIEAKGFVPPMESAAAVGAFSRLSSMAACPPSITSPLSVEKQCSPISSKLSLVMMGWPGGRSSRQKSFAVLASRFILAAPSCPPPPAPGSARFEKQSTTISRNLTQDARSESAARTSAPLPSATPSPRTFSRKSRPRTPSTILITGRNSRSAPASSALPIRSAMYRRHGLRAELADRTPLDAAALSSAVLVNVPGARFGIDAWTHRRRSSDLRAIRTWFRRDASCALNGGALTVPLPGPTPGPYGPARLGAPVVASRYDPARAHSR